MKPAALPNRPGEPEFQMKLSADFITFLCTLNGKPVQFDLTITNSCAEAQSFKVKCTSGVIFRVQPPINVLAPGASCNIRFYFQVHSRLKSSFRRMLQFQILQSSVTTSPYTTLNAKELWTKTTSFEGVKRLPIAFIDRREPKPSTPSAPAVAAG